MEARRISAGVRSGLRRPEEQPPSRGTGDQPSAVFAHPGDNGWCTGFSLQNIRRHYGRRVALLSSLLLSFTLSLFAAETKPKADTNAAWGIGQAVVDAQGRKDEAETAAAGVSITDDGWQVDNRKTDDRVMTRRFHLNTGGPLKYGLNLDQVQKKEPNGDWKTIRSGLNMQEPAYGNWLAFADLAVNGRSIHDKDERVEVEVVETGARGIIDFHWVHPLITTRTRFIAEPGADHLLVELRWQPRGGVKTVSAGFSCYPQGFWVAQEDKLNGLAAARCITTLTRDILQVQKVTVNPASEWWFLYHDLTMDKARRAANFNSPCALIVLPEELAAMPGNPERVRLDVGSYGVSTGVELDPAGGRARFAIWDSFGDKTTAQAKAQMREDASKVRERMAQGSWLPTAIEKLNVAAERTQLEELARKLGSKSAERLTALRQQLEQLAAQQTALSTSPEPIRVERELTAALTRYRTLRFQTERPARQDVRVLFLAGPTAYAWRVEEIVKTRWGADAVRRGGYVWKYWVGHRLTYFPGTLTELYTYDVVVLADFPTDPLTPEQQQWLADFVKQGGGLLMLGGYYAFSPGGWADSPLAPLFPVELKTGLDLQPLTGETTLNVARKVIMANGSKLKPPLPGKDLGVVPWRHNLKPREGAAVWLTAGGEPVAVSGAAGEGRVLAVLGTALGEAPAGQTACWDAPNWPALLERLLEYLARGR